MKVIAPEEHDSIRFLFKTATIYAGALRHEQYVKSG